MYPAWQYFYKGQASPGVVNADFLRRLLVVGGERSVLEEMTEYIPLSKEASECIRTMLSKREQDLKPENERVRALERQADEISMKIKHEITSGAISSNVMDNLIELVEKCDDLLDQSYYISREIKRMGPRLKVQNDASRNAVDHAYTVFANMIEIHLRALDHVRIAFTGRQIAEVQAARHEIEKLEEQVDEMKDNLIDSLYEMSQYVSYIVFLHLTELTHKIDDLLDDCEDIADLVQTVRLSVTK